MLSHQTWGLALLGQRSSAFTHIHSPRPSHSNMDTMCPEIHTHTQFYWNTCA